MARQQRHDAQHLVVKLGLVAHARERHAADGRRAACLPGGVRNDALDPGEQRYDGERPISIEGGSLWWKNHSIDERCLA